MPKTFKKNCCFFPGKRGEKKQRRGKKQQRRGKKNKGNKTCFHQYIFDFFCKTFTKNTSTTILR